MEYRRNSILENEGILVRESNTPSGGRKLGTTHLRVGKSLGFHPVLIGLS